MKKIICLFLTICMLTCPTVFAAEKTYDMGKTVEFLTTLGIASDFSENLFPEDDPVTRATFSETIAKMIRVDGEKSDNIYYHDVSKDYWAFNYISVLTEKGIFSGNGENFFRPDDVITRNEATKVLLSLMGYDTYAQIDGGYPKGYVKYAQEVKLYKHCSASSVLTYGDMFCMVENALKGKIAKVKYEVGGATLAMDEDETLLSRYYDMYYDEGVLTGAGGIDIADGGELKKDYVRINSVEYKTDKDLFGYLGSEMEFVYYDDGSDNPEIVWTNELDTNEVLEISADFDCVFDDQNYEFEYTENGSGKIKTAKLSPGLIMVYNGDIVYTGIEEILKKDRFDLRLVKGKNDKKYTLAVVWAYENYVAGNIDKSKKIVYDKQNPEKSIVLDEDKYDYCDIYFNGIKKDFDDIAEKNTVSIYKSLDGNKIRAEISTNVVSGIVKSISTEDEETKVIFEDGTGYKYYLKNPNINIAIKDEAKLYLDTKGCIVWAERTSKPEFFGYIIKVSFDEDESLVKIKLLNENGSIDTYSVSEKAKLDGAKYKTDIMYNLLKDKQQLAVFKINKNSEITYIDTIDWSNENRNTSFREYQPEATRLYKSFGRLGTTLLVDENTKIFAVDTDANKSLTERYMIKSKNDLKNDVYYNSMAFRYGSDERVYEEVLLMKDVNWDSSSANTACVIVSSIDEALNDQDEIVELLSGYQKGTAIKMYTDGNYSVSSSGISEGDVIRIQVNDKGAISGADLIYDYDIQKSYSTSDAWTSFSARCMYAHDKIDNALKVGYNDGTTFNEIFDLSSVPIVVYDSSYASGKRIRVGNMGDIVTYKMRGSNCSKVIVQTNYAYPICAIVYN